MSERKAGVSNVLQLAANGGVPIGSGERMGVRARFHDAAEFYCKTKQELIELLYPSHYRVIIYGSSRSPKGTPEYNRIRDLAERLVTDLDCDIITGGGQGVMHAAMEGGRIARQKAKGQGRELKSINIGLRVKLPFEENPNPDIDLLTRHSGFSTRLDEFISLGHALYLAPGGYGTDYERADVIQLRQVHHIEDGFPIIMDPFWEEIMEVKYRKMYTEQIAQGNVPYISKGDADGLVYTDKIDEVLGIIAPHNKWWKENVRDHVRRTPRISEEQLTFDYEFDRKPEEQLILFDHNLQPTS